MLSHSAFSHFDLSPLLPPNLERIKDEEISSGLSYKGGTSTATEAWGERFHCFPGMEEMRCSLHSSSVSPKERGTRKDGNRKHCFILYWT